MEQKNKDRDPERFRVVASADSHFAWMRTRFATDRTFMAWLRTAASLIGFGFTIVTFFTHMKGTERAPVPIVLGLALIATGVVALAMSLAQYIHTVNVLEGPHYAEIADPGTSRRPAVWLAIVMMLLGVAAFVAIIVRMVLP